MLNLLRCIIAGSRSFNDYLLLEKYVRRFLKGYRPSQVEIVSGKAEGADALGEKFAQEKGCRLMEFPAHWETYGRAAGFLRNQEMAEYADACICFWDGRSNGTRSMIRLAEENNLDLMVVLFGGWEWYAHPESNCVFIGLPNEEHDGLCVQLGPVGEVSKDAIKKLSEIQGYDLSKDTIDLTIPCL